MLGFLEKMQKDFEEEKHDISLENEDVMEL